MSRLPVLFMLTTLFAGLTVGFGGCMHNIHVSPDPGVVSIAPIPLSLKVEVTWFALEGADHMPGIFDLNWSWRDFRQAVVTYIQKRRSFKSVGLEPADLTLSIRSFLTMRSRVHYTYHLRLESTLASNKKPVGTYVTEAQADGSAIRWNTASDQEPIAEVVRLALDELLTNIEADRAQTLRADGP
ncbi:MAG: hypothetical protein ACT4OO_14270 [Nitrospiraceae bacterium]